MCYSAMIQADYRHYVREWDSKLSIKEFVDLFWWRWNPDEIYRKRHGRPRIPRAMEDAFQWPQTEEERQIRTYIEEANEREALGLQAELFKQRARLANAQRALTANPAKPTKKTLEDLRIATNKVEQIKGWLSDLERKEPRPIDSRIYPQFYAPVMVMEGGQRIVRPMRYQCRPLGTPPVFDRKYPGTYNARRDNLGGSFWRPLFGRCHGLIIASAFYENVPRHKAEGRELAPGEEAENTILEFRPRTRQDMLVACIWSRWTAPGEPDLLSFAAITDEPPPEVAAAGHDRCIIPIRAQNVDAWLQPDSRNLEAQQAILDDREAPYYEHRLAA